MASTIIPYNDNPGSIMAEDVVYDNSNSELSATDVNGAIDELADIVGGISYDSVNEMIIIPSSIGTYDSTEEMIELAL